MARAEPPKVLQVAVAWSPSPGAALEKPVRVAAGSTVLDAIRAGGIADDAEAMVDVSTQEVGIWGRIVTLDAVLEDGDRVEIYRPLVVAPNEARRRRARRKAGPGR